MQLAQKEEPRQWQHIKRGPSCPVKQLGSMPVSKKRLDAQLVQKEEPQWRQHIYVALAGHVEQWGCVPFSTKSGRRWR